MVGPHDELARFASQDDAGRRVSYQLVKLGSGSTVVGHRFTVVQEDGKESILLSPTGRLIFEM
ncbi:hypothetical protein IV102_12120 [bacterium]|nr:hypothetical protein [bacterium]